MSDPEQSFQSQLMETAAEDTTVTGYQVGLTWYLPKAGRPANRIELFGDALDPVGVPAMRIRFALTDADRDAIARARLDQAHVADALGVFDQERETAVLLPAGSSLHMTGSVRTSAVDDGTSVCDPDGLVWGTENVLVVGNRVLPAALIIEGARG